MWIYGNLVPRLPFRLSVALHFSRTASDGKLEGKPGNEARYMDSTAWL